MLRRFISCGSQETWIRISDPERDQQYGTLNAGPKHSGWHIDFCHSHVIYHKFVTGFFVPSHCSVTLTNPQPRLSFSERPEHKREPPCVHKHKDPPGTKRTLVPLFCFVCVLIRVCFYIPRFFRVYTNKTPVQCSPFGTVCVSAGSGPGGPWGARVRCRVRKWGSGPPGRLFSGLHGHAGHAGLRIWHTLRVRHLLPVYCQRGAGIL